MNKKQLTNDQIKELHKLVERNAIKYYDVEVEIVDHYASAIEEIWAKDPSISFYRAQMIVYKEFWDFQGLVKDKRLALSKRAYKECWGHLKNAFIWPKMVELIIITTLLFYGFHFLFGYISPQSLIYKLTLPGLLIAVIHFSGIRFYKKLGYSFLRLDTMLGSFSFLAIMWLNVLLHLSDFISLSSTTTMIGFSAVFALFLIMTKETFKLLKTEVSNLKKQYSIS